MSPAYAREFSARFAYAAALTSVTVGSSRTLAEMHEATSVTQTDARDRWYTARDLLEYVEEER